MKHVLVTGAAGFIGSHVSQRFLDAGVKVTGVDDMSNGHLEFVPAGVELHMADFASPTILNKVLDKEFDAIVHLAAVPRVSYSVEYPEFTNEVNVTKTLRLLEVCRGGEIKRFVFASSSSVYGGADELPTHESSRKNPQSPYALQKSIVEDYLAMYGKLYNFDSICLRFFNVFGPRALGSSPYATAVSAWLTAIKNGKPMRSDGDGSQSRDMCYVDNVADACYRAATKEGSVTSGLRLNVACGDRTTNKEIRDFLIERYKGATYEDAPWRAGDVMHTQADISEAEKHIGYKPIVRFWEGLSRTCDWYDQNWDWAKELKLRT